MVLFAYISTDINGTTLRGELEAEDAQDLKANLTAQKQFLVSCRVIQKLQVDSPLSVSPHISQIDRQNPNNLRFLRHPLIRLDEWVNQGFDYVYRSAGLATRASNG